MDGCRGVLGGIGKMDGWMDDGVAVGWLVDGRTMIMCF